MIRCIGTIMAGGDISKYMRQYCHENEIKCIFFSEFDTTAGRKITFQVPEDYISKDVFDSLSVYIITKQLQKKVVTVNALGHKVIGYPVGIDSPEYDRNEYLFNLCFVCDERSRTVHYEPVLEKIANYLITLETEIKFLSCEKSKPGIVNIMWQILEGLNQVGHCEIPINESNTMYLKVVKVYPDPNQVEDFQVPIFTVPRHSFSTTDWDLTTQQILPYIDGVNHVAKIAAEADVEIRLVKSCIQHMVYYGVVKLVPIFQYTNVYTVTPQIRKLAGDRNLQEECLRYVAKNEKQLPTFKDTFTLYCALSPGTTVKDVCIRHSPQVLKIDERKLIQFGIMKGLIRRLNKYPIQLNASENGGASSIGLQKHHYRRYFDGLHSYDEICCKTGMNYHELEDKVEKDPGNVVVCWK